MIDINSEKKSQYQNILSDEAISFLEKVCSTFENTRQEILKNRVNTRGIQGIQNLVFLYEAVRRLMNTFKVDGLTRALTRQL